MLRMKRIPRDPVKMAKNIDDRAKLIWSGLGGSQLNYLKEYGGCSGFIGSGTITNSSLISFQFSFALGANSHPSVNRFIEELEKVPYDGNNHKIIKGLIYKFLIEAQVFEGIKILDLGCGGRPPFGRVLRVMGAEVYTADLLDAKDFEFEFYDGGFNQTARNVEIRDHVVCDLSFPESAEKMLKQTGGNFDLVTHSHLNSGWLRSKKGPFDLDSSLNLLLPLVLKKFGIHYFPSGVKGLDIYLGEGKFLKVHEKWDSEKGGNVLKEKISPRI